MTQPLLIDNPDMRRGLIFQYLLTHTPLEINLSNIAKDLYMTLDKAKRSLNELEALNWITSQTVKSRTLYAAPYELASETAAIAGVSTHAVYDYAWRYKDVCNPQPSLIVQFGVIHSGIANHYLNGPIKRVPQKPEGYVPLKRYEPEVKKAILGKGKELARVHGLMYVSREFAEHVRLTCK
jgi:hypothetical protein